MAEGGGIILSGLLDDQQDKVITAHEKLGLTLKDNLVHNGWATLVIGKIIMNAQEKLTALRAWMAERQLDVVMVPRGDVFQGEKPAI